MAMIGRIGIQFHPRSATRAGACHARKLPLWHLRLRAKLDLGRLHRRGGRAYPRQVGEEGRVICGLSAEWIQRWRRCWSSCIGTAHLHLRGYWLHACRRAGAVVETFRTHLRIPLVAVDARARFLGGSPA